MKTNSDDADNCKLCDYKTMIVFNINLAAVPICERCANEIAEQQVQDLTHKAFLATKAREK